MPKVDENYKNDNAKFQMPELSGLYLLVTLNGEGATNVKYEQVGVAKEQPPGVGLQSPATRPPSPPPELQPLLATRPPSSSSSSSSSLDSMRTLGHQVSGFS